VLFLTIATVIFFFQKRRIYHIRSYRSRNIV